MYFDLELKIRRRDKYFNLTLEDTRTKVKKSFFMNYLFYLNIFLKSFGLKIHKLELKEFDGNVFQTDVSEEAKQNKYNEFKKLFVIKKSINEEETLNRDEELFLVQSDLKRFGKFVRHKLFTIKKEIKQID